MSLVIWDCLRSASVRSVFSGHPADIGIHNFKTSFSLSKHLLKKICKEIRNLFSEFMKRCLIPNLFRFA